MNLYQIEDILANRLVRGNQEFLVKWKGYDAEKDSTWEGYENLQGTEELIARFLAEKEARNKEVEEVLSKQLTAVRHQQEEAATMS